MVNALQSISLVETAGPMGCPAIRIKLLDDHVIELHYENASHAQADFNRAEGDLRNALFCRTKRYNVS
jgi:hypothetical protein